MVTAMSLGVACGDARFEPDEPTVDTSQQELFSLPSTDTPTNEHTPIGLALEIDNGESPVLRVRAGQRFFIDQLDVRTSLDTDHDRGVDGLSQDGDFAHLNWDGIELRDEEFVGLANADGTFTRRQFFRGARWMDRRSFFIITQIDRNGRPTTFPWFVNIGRDEDRRRSDGFFVRRLRAIQWAFDCAAVDDCSSATQFQEEALVEVRNASRPFPAIRMRSNTVALRVRWSLQPFQPYTIDVEQVADPAFDYGLQVDVEPTSTPPGGVYAPGSTIPVRVTLRDGSGKRLHSEGSLPTYNEVIFGENEPGIQYYRAFFDPTATYYRRKHRERMLMAQLIGPAHRIQPIRSIIDLDAFLGPDDTQVVGLPERDGVYAEFSTIPPANDLFGGAFDPTQAGWFAPVSDTINFRVPDDAEPGTYLVTVKARRTYLGQDIPRSETVEVQVGTPEPTAPVLNTGPCNTCHSGPSDLNVVLHANDNRAACAGCHVPLGFELEGPIFVRTHFIHSRSDRFDAELTECNNCHLDRQGIQRTSKAACLSCHQSYPPDHELAYGPVESMYIGGGRESFTQCSDSCHTNHPSSGL